ncbi:MAG: hypothetical protein ACTSPI_03325, partial [Candidatus Heimdallarchaeaceae archaeon]
MAADGVVTITLGISDLTGAPLRTIDLRLKNLGQTVNKHVRKPFAEASKSAKGFTSTLSEMVRNMPRLIVTFGATYTAIKFFIKGIQAIANEFQLGSKAITEYERAILGMAASITSLSQGSGSLAAIYEKAKIYAKDLVEQIEILSAKSIASAHEMTYVTTVMIQKGILINTQIKEQREGLVAIVDAIKLITAGQNFEIQGRQEIRGLLDGTMKATNQLLMLLRAQNPEIVKQINLHRKQGDLIEFLADQLKGFVSAQKDVLKLTETWGATLSTINRRILRGAFRPYYEWKVKQLEEISSLLMDEKGQLTEISEVLQLGLKGSLDVIIGTLEMIKAATIEINTIFKGMTGIGIPKLFKDWYYWIKRSGIGLIELSTILGKLVIAITDFQIAPWSQPFERFYEEVKLIEETTRGVLTDLYDEVYGEKKKKKTPTDYAFQIGTSLSETLKKISEEVEKFTTSNIDKQINKYKELRKELEEGSKKAIEAWTNVMEEAQSKEGLSGLPGWITGMSSKQKENLKREAENSIKGAKANLTIIKNETKKAYTGLNKIIAQLNQKKLKIIDDELKKEFDSIRKEYEKEKKEHEKAIKEKWQRQSDAIEKDYKLYIDNHKKLKKLQKEYEQNRIDLMEDGFEKRKKRIELERDIKIKALEDIVGMEKETTELIEKIKIQSSERIQKAYREECQTTINIGRDLASSIVDSFGKDTFGEALSKNLGGSFANALKDALAEKLKFDLVLEKNFLKDIPNMINAGISAIGGFFGLGGGGGSGKGRGGSKTMGVIQGINTARGISELGGIWAGIGSGLGLTTSTYGAGSTVMYGGNMISMPGEITSGPIINPEMWSNIGKGLGGAGLGYMGGNIINNMVNPYGGGYGGFGGALGGGIAAAAGAGGWGIPIAIGSSLLGSLFGKKKRPRDQRTTMFDYSAPLFEWMSGYGGGIMSEHITGSESDMEKGIREAITKMSSSIFENMAEVFTKTLSEEASYKFIEELRNTTVNMQGFVTKTAYNEDFGAMMEGWITSLVPLHIWADTVDIWKDYLTEMGIGVEEAEAKTKELHDKLTSIRGEDAPEATWQSLTQYVKDQLTGITDEWKEYIEAVGFYFNEIDAALHPIQHKFDEQERDIKGWKANMIKLAEIIGISIDDVIIAFNKMMYNLSISKGQAQIGWTKEVGSKAGGLSWGLQTKMAIWEANVWYNNMHDNMVELYSDTDKFTDAIKLLDNAMDKLIESINETRAAAGVDWTMEMLERINPEQRDKFSSYIQEIIGYKSTQYLKEQMDFVENTYGPGAYGITGGQRWVPGAGSQNSPSGTVRRKGKGWEQLVSLSPLEVMKQDYAAEYQRYQDAINLAELATEEYRKSLIDEFFPTMDQITEDITEALKLYYGALTERQRELERTQHDLESSISQRESNIFGLSSTMANL